MSLTRLEVYLDENQAEIATAEVSRRQVVTAGPGTGKTRTLLARARYLLEEEEIERSDELLILSFSRAAVDTVTRRSDEMRHLGRLPIRTIDSFAARLVQEAGQSPEGLSFDRRIRVATQYLKAEPESLPSVASLRHVLVDEAQDIVGVRYGFMRCLLESVASREENGFTVFGDRAQAIYEFQEHDAVSSGPARLLRWLVGCAEAAPHIDHRELTTNYRMESKRLVSLAERYGEQIRSEHGDPKEILSDLDFEMGEDSGWQEVENAHEVIREVIAAQKTVAVLCRSNAEVLRLGAILQASGLDVQVNHRARDRGAAPWIADRFSKVPVGSVKFGQCEGSEARPWLRTPETAEQALRYGGFMIGQEINLTRIAQAIRAGTCPESLAATREAPVVVSTIHRAKGQEFDSVFVVRNRLRGEGEVGEEARLLYVAATRAREDLCQCGELDLEGPIRASRDERGFVGNWSKPSRPRFVEVRVSDSDPNWHPGNLELFADTQEYLAGRVSPGDEIELRLVEYPGHDVPIYDAWHRQGGEYGRVIGRTTESLGEFIKQYVWGRTPTMIRGLVADIPDTVSMKSALARKVGLAEHGLHLRARFYGLGRLEWGAVQ